MCGFPEYRGAFVGGSAQPKPGFVLCQAFNREGSLGGPLGLRGDGQRMGGHFDPSSWAMAEGHLLGRLAPPAHPTCHCGVESYFDSWRFLVNLSLCNTCPHPAVGPLSHLAQWGFCILRIATFSVASCAVSIGARGLKVIRTPCGVRLQKLQGLVHSPPLPQPLSTPAGAERGAQQPYVANAVCGVAFTGRRQHSNSPGTT